MPRRLMRPRNLLNSLCSVVCGMRREENESEMGVLGVVFLWGCIYTHRHARRLDLKQRAKW